MDKVQNSARSARMMNDEGRLALVETICAQRSELFIRTSSFVNRTSLQLPIYTTPTTFGMDRDDTFGIGFFSDNRCALTVKRKSGYYTGCIDVDGNEVIPFEFADIRHFTHGYAYAEPHMRGVDFWGGHREG